MNAREQWLIDRMSGIGGSDAAAVLGLSKYKTPLEVYQEKRGEIGPIPDNEPMLWGRVLEPVIRQQYAERTGRVVRLPDGIIRHQEHPFMLATVDGITDDGRLVEIKTARTAQDWGEAGSDEVPQAYLIQVQHYLEVTALPVADVAVLIGGSDFRLYHIEADRELQQMIVEGEAEFWDRVQRSEPPEPVSYADVQARFGKSSREGSVEADIMTAEAVAMLKRIRESMKTLEEEEEQAKAVIMKVLGENETLIQQGKILATWKAQAGSKRFDSKTFQAHHPDLYSQFVAIGEPSRRFLLK
jgi:putative phage-type endonuclease